ncbi:beta-ketoacyl synthase chain length factor [Christiangramia salexigens]|uniref:3-oxoacyl-ACP synthase n=1 Tax=Christiangramia salexigens TaxID=1913577 RepID=A0A1L3J309_9FLAO|nr:beta-ketoacyl synthase chain length factor [Christiangramia salexigens]APG59509.1 3-oxoacyl-ACP synthase [Christiangramia salexigens]
MNRLYINGISSISPQPEDFLETGEIRVYSENIISAIEMDYKSLIRPMQLRRMSKAVKMGIYCTLKCMEDAGTHDLDAIIIGSGQGCQQDTEKFLESMLKNDELILSPTSFIQSTHNTVGGQIALHLQCYAYNMTYTQNSVSFESALNDALMQNMKLTEPNSILVGGVDEISKSFTGFLRLDGQIKQNDIENTGLFNSNSSGTIFSESAAFFALSNNSDSKTYAEILGVDIFNSAENYEVPDKIKAFLKTYDLETSDIDLILLGNNGDIRYNDYYRILQEHLFKATPQLGYKHLIGENNSASAYAVWLACKIFKKNNIPDVLKLNTLNYSKPKYILIYNQYLGKNHGLILLQKP